MNPVFGNIQSSKLKVKQFFSLFSQLDKPSGIVSIWLFLQGKKKPKKMIIGLSLNCLKV